MATLKATKREGAGKYAAFRLRKSGRIPGILYGRKMENVQVEVPVKELTLALDKGERLLDLEVEGKAQRVIIKDVQRATFDHEILHADFYAIAEDTTLNVDVRVEIRGEAVGKSNGGVVEQFIFTVEVECFPKDLPEKIILDVTALELGQVLYVKDLPKLPGVKITAGPDLAIVSCHLPLIVEVAAPAPVAGAAEGEAAAPAQPEVIGEKDRLEKEKAKQEEE